MKCNNCGAEFSSKFCPECGKAVSQEQIFSQTVEEKIAACDSQASIAQQSKNIGHQNDQSEKITDNSAAEAKRVDIANVSDVNPKHGKTIAGTINTVNGKLAELNKTGIIDKIMKWTPAIAPIFFGVLILLFMAAPAFGGELFELAAELGGVGNSLYILMGEGGSATACTVFLLLCALGFMAVGGVRLYFTIKNYKPYAKQFMVVQDILLGLVFLLSCILVGNCNTLVTKAGAGGALLVASAVIGIVVHVALIFVKKAVTPILTPQVFTERVKKEKPVAYAQQFASQPPAQSVQFQKNQNSPAETPGLTNSNSCQTLCKSIPDTQPNAIYVNLAEQPPVKYGKIVKAYRLLPAISAMILSFICVFVYMIKSILEFDELTSDDLSSKIWYSLGIILSIAYFFTGVIRLKKAYSKPYEKHPFLLLLQGVIFSGIIFSCILDAITSYFVWPIVIGSISALLYMISAYAVLETHTYKHTDQIRQARVDCNNGNKKMTKKSIILTSIMLAIFIVVSVVGPLYLIFNSGSININSYYEVTLGDSDSTVKAILGEPDKIIGDGASKTFMFYSKNYNDLTSKKSSGGKDNFEDFEDIEDLENSFNESIKDQEKLDNLTFQYLEILFTIDENGYTVSKKAFNKKATMASLKSKNKQGKETFDIRNEGENYYVRYTDESIEEGILNNYSIESASSQGREYVGILESYDNRKYEIEFYGLLREKYAETVSGNQLFKNGNLPNGYNTEAFENYDSIAMDSSETQFLERLDGDNYSTHENEFEFINQTYFKKEILNLPEINSTSNPQKLNFSTMQLEGSMSKILYLKSFNTNTKNKQKTVSSINTSVVYSAVRGKCGLSFTAVYSDGSKATGFYTKEQDLFDVKSNNWVDDVRIELTIPFTDTKHKISLSQSDYLKLSNTQKLSKTVITVTKGERQGIEHIYHIDFTRVENAVSYKMEIYKNGTLGIYDQISFGQNGIATSTNTAFRFTMSTAVYPAGSYTVKITALPSENSSSYAPSDVASNTFSNYN